MTELTVIEATREVLTDYPYINQFTGGVHIDFTDDTQVTFGLSPIGDRLVRETITGKQTRMHSFVMYATNQTFTDYDRLANSNFLVDLGYYLEEKGNVDVIAKISDEKYKKGTIDSISCANGMMYSIPSGDINNFVTYQLQIYVTYTLESEEHTWQ